MPVIRINCDLGEGCGADAALMPLIDQASIACGGHAGDAASMRATVALAGQHGVSIGAHPAYPDREGFGRRSLDLPAATLHDALTGQVRALLDVAAEAGLRVAYCKPHGALYHDMLDDAAVAGVVVEVARAAGLALVVPAGRADTAVHTAAAASNVSLWAEAFADRAYGDDGRLLARSDPGAVLNAAAAAAQARALLSGSVVTATGTRLRLMADTVCVHGDSPDAVAITRAVRQAVAAARSER